MPRIELYDPWGQTYRIDTRNEKTLREWFAEICPLVNFSFGIGDVPCATIFIHPMWGGAGAQVSDPDWLTDSRVLGRRYEFRAKDGEEAMWMLTHLRATLEKAVNEGNFSGR